MALLACNVKPGLRAAEATVQIKDYSGRTEFLPVDRDMLHQKGNQSYLPVTLVHLNRAKKVALVSLPVETDSGAHQLWVKLADLKEYSETPA